MSHRILRSVAATVLLTVAPGAVAWAQDPVQTDAVPSPMPQAVLSPRAVELLDLAVAGTMQSDVTLEARPYFFPALQGGTLMMMGFEVGKNGMLFGANAAAGVDAAGMPVETASLELFGSIRQDAVEVRRVGAAFDLRRDLGSETASIVHSFGDTLPPGTYEVVWGLFDTVSGVAATRRDTVEVPAFGFQLTTSTVLVARAFAAGQGTFGPNTVYPGVRVLTATFDDDLDRVIDLSTTPEVSLTFIVIGAQLDPATQAFNLELTYRIIDAETDQSVSRTPPQALNRTTVAQAIPLSTVAALEPGGAYRFEITVKDLTAGEETVVEVPFEIAG